MLLSNFPAPYEDELLYSLIGRFSTRLRYPSRKCILWNVLGAGTLTAAIEFPARLRTLISRLPPSHSCATEEIIERHTLYPWYAPFLETENRRRLRAAMLDGAGECTWGLAGLLASSIRVPKALRFCPECFRQDWRSGIEPYWRRLHQITGIEVCPVHRIQIEDSAVLRLNRITRHEFTPPDKDLMSVTARPSLASDALIQISRLAESLLSCGGINVPVQQIRLNVVHLLRNRSFATVAGNIKISELSREFRQTFPESFRDAVGGVEWINRIGQRNRPLAPIQYLILLALSNANTQDLFTIPGPLILRSGPACTNPLCSKQGNFTTFHGVQHSRDHESLVEIFVCNECERQFARCSTSREKIWVRDYGRLWHRRLQELWNDPNWSLRAIGRALAQDPITIKREAFNIGLVFPRQGPRPSTKKGLRITKPSHISRVSNLQRRWLSARNKHPFCHRTELRKLVPRVYAALYRRDRNWLFENSPARAGVKSRKERVNWRLRDEELSNRLLLAYQQVRSNQPRQRISSKLLLRTTGGMIWETKLHLLPTSVRLLQELAEDRVAFAIRRIECVTETAVSDRKKLKGWQLIREAGLRTDLIKNETVRTQLVISIRKIAAAC